MNEAEEVLELVYRFGDFHFEKTTTDNRLKLSFKLVPRAKREGCKLTIERLPEYGNSIPLLKAWRPRKPATLTVWSEGGETFVELAYEDEKEEPGEGKTARYEVFSHGGVMTIRELLYLAAVESLNNIDIVKACFDNSDPQAEELRFMLDRAKEALREKVGEHG